MTEAVIRANRDSEGGFGAGGSNEAVTQSSVADRATAERALAHWRGPDDGTLEYEADRVAQNARKMIEAIGAARAMAGLACRSAGYLLPLKPERSRALVAEIEGGPAQCVNCHCDVWRTADDRLRAGRCTACYQYRYRHDGVERPKELWEPQADRGPKAARAVVSSA